MSVSRRYCFTLNNPLPEDRDLISCMDCAYMVYGDEIGEQGTSHLQGFIIFNSSKRFNSLKKIHPRIHWEITRGTSQQASDYCKKDGKFFERGQLPMTQEEKGKKGKEYWEEQVKLAKQDPLLCDEKLQITHIGNLEKIHNLYNKRRKFEVLSILEHEWFIGESGSGKSSTARREHPDAYMKQCNKWWNDYQYQEVVIIDDLDTTHEWMAYFINQWADHYSFPAETKGGQITIRPRKIIVTSRFQPDQVFKDISTINSIERRFKKRFFPEEVSSK